MGKICGASEGKKLLDALGVDTSGRITKAVITIEVGRPVTVECTLLTEFDPEAGQLKRVCEHYQMVKVNEPSPTT